MVYPAPLSQPCTGLQGILLKKQQQQNKHISSPSRNPIKPKHDKWSKSRSAKVWRTLHFCKSFRLRFACGLGFGSRYFIKVRVRVGLKLGEKSGFDDLGFHAFLFSVKGPSIKPSCFLFKRTGLIWVWTPSYSSLTKKWFGGRIRTANGQRLLSNSFKRATTSNRQTGKNWAAIVQKWADVGEKDFGRQRNEKWKWEGRWWRRLSIAGKWEVR